MVCERQVIRRCTQQSVCTSKSMKPFDITGRWLCYTAVNNVGQARLSRIVSTASMMPKMYDVRLRVQDLSMKGACRAASSNQSSMVGLDGILSCARLSMTGRGLLVMPETDEQVVSVLHMEGQVLQHHC